MNSSINSIGFDVWGVWQKYLVIIEHLCLHAVIHSVQNAFKKVCIIFVYSFVTTKLSYWILFPDCRILDREKRIASCIYCHKQAQFTLFSENVCFKIRKMSFCWFHYKELLLCWLSRFSYQHHFWTHLNRLTSQPWHEQLNFKRNTWTRVWAKW